MVLKKQFSLLFFMLFFTFFINAQHTFSRIEADFSIKQKQENGNQALTMGKLFFDLKNKQLIYVISFPKKEIIFIQDSIVCHVVDNQIMSRKGSENLLSFSIFNLALQGELPYFGLKKTSFKLEKIENEEGMLISTWLPPMSLKNSKGKIILSQKKKQLFGLVVFTPQNEILAKQFFRKYQNFQGLFFPTEVLEYMYIDSQQNIKITTYKNVKINNYTTDTYYQYHLPK